MTSARDSKAKRRPSFEMVVIGGTGDLAQRKLFPALFILKKYQEISEESRILAVARHPETEEDFRDEIGPKAASYVEKDEFDQAPWDEFWQGISYHALSATDQEAMRGLGAILDQNPERVRIFYLATAPSLYGEISRTLHAAGLVHASTRIVLEKPIGRDLDSAREINEQVGAVFEESQIYRIDHYLGKETVQNLMALRFGNSMFEPLWDSRSIDHVQITVAETLGMEGRASYYDHSGAVRDMVQNHLLQLLCLTAMEPPALLEQDSIRHEKLKVLKALRPIARADVRDNTVRGQYQAGAVAGKAVCGYLEEPGIPSDSETETFCVLRCHIDNWRWAGTPFFLRTGKRMGHRVSEIIIEYKEVPHKLFLDQNDQLEANRLVIRLQPDESIKLSLMAKAPGSGVRLRREFLNLNLRDRPGERTLLAYERLLLDVVKGSTTLFMHRDEVEEAWRWVEPILDEWESSNSRPRFYSAGSWGPPESIALILKNGRSWYEHVV